MCKRTLLASPIVLLAAMILLAQEGAWSASPPKVQLAQVPIVAGAPILFFSLPSELSRSVVRNIIQDDQGFLWFGKREGLWRYDGYRFIRFPSDSPDPRGAGGVYVYTLYKDRLGRLWIGFDVSLDRYDPSTGKIQQYRAPAGDPCGALGPVFQISEDREGIFWLATESGLKRLDPKTSKVTCYQHEQGDNSSIASNLVRSTLESRNGTFWVANAKGLDIFDRRTGKVTRHILWQREGIKGASVSTSLLEDHAGLLWQGSSLGGGLASIDPVTGNVTVYSFRSLVSKRNVTYGVVAVLQDDEGALWLGTDGQGILKLDRDRRHAVQYRTDPNHSDSLSNDNVAALFTDHAGSFWVSTEGGYVDRFSSSPSIFRNYRHQSGNANSLIDDFVISAYEDSHGTLWVGTERGLNRIDQRTGEVIRYESGARGLVEPFKTGVRSIVEDRNGNLWFGSRGSGLERFDPQSGQTRTYRHVPSDPNSLSEGYIACLFVDHRGTLWAATNDGLNRFDTERQQFQFYRAEVAGLVRYHSIAEDSQGALWLGSFGFGVHRFDPQTGRFTVYQNKSGDAHSLSSNRVNSVYIDRAGTLWAATYSGLNKFDPTSQSFTSYHVNDGLPSDAVFGVLEDEHGYLWLSTSAGLARFNPRSLTFTNYHLSDGLPTDLFTPLVVASKSRTGKMFFGTYSGLVTFFPSQAVDPSPVLPVILTDFRLFGVSVQVGTGPLKQPIWSTRVLTLPERSIFSFEFSAPSYSDPERNRYRYRLEGLESKWNETDSSHRYAAYSNLAPGQYLFRVQGSDSHGIWNTTGASVQIRVLAPFYRTNWFRALCVAAFLALLYGIYRLRVAQLRAQEEKFREAIESIPAMAFVAQPDGNRTFVNKGWVEYTGMTVEQAAGSGWQEAVHPEDRKRVVAKWQSAMASGEP
ncbi:MAG TPA: two-component regulator propeller domain-containing protein, partial [Methylococcaceae bacterium]|nr:two-component regulator propeller domain-containing protein [Methylococcaceae bacterium]